MSAADFMEGMEDLTRGIARAVILCAVASVLMVVSAGSTSAARFTYGNPAFCAPEIPVRDFGFSRLPSVREVSESAKGLGYGAVTMGGGWPRVMPEPVSFGYGFSEHDYSGKALLNWTVTAQLWTINNQGTAVKKVDHNELFIGRLDAARQPFIEVDPLENRLGFYRFDMQIANKNGKVIGSYGAYFKVVRPSWHPKLRLVRDVLRPGERLLIRIENHGSETVSYVESFSVQRFEEGQWMPVPGLAEGRWRMWLGLLSPGKTGRCNSLSLPADTTPGLYRIVKRAGTKVWPEGRRARLAAPFEVIDPATSVEY